jgi:hypothetical protein
MSLAPRVEFDRLIALLRRDGEWASAVAPAKMLADERRSAGGPPDPQREAIWTHRDAYELERDPRRIELQRLVDAYTQEYGHEPDALQLASFQRGEP